MWSRDLKPTRTGHLGGVWFPATFRHSHKTRRHATVLSRTVNNTMGKSCGDEIVVHNVVARRSVAWRGLAGNKHPLR
jgi:hypothetical protein